MDTSLLKRPVINDFNAFIEMKAKAVSDPNATLTKAAKQFEAIFMQNMMKSMRQSSHFLSEESPLRSKQVDTFEEMLDKQRSLECSSENKGIGLADMMVKQLDKKNIEFQYQDRSIKRNGNYLPQLETNNLLSKVAERKSMVLTPKDFIDAVWPVAKEFAKHLGVDPKMLVAQAAHETGWGKYINEDSKGASSFNLFNIKAGSSWNKKEVDVLTTEYVNGKAIKVNEPFRSYTSFDDSFKDYVSLIKNNDRYEKALSVSHDPKRYIEHLQEAGYATDPNYADKIMSIYEGDRLTSTLQDKERK